MIGEVRLDGLISIISCMFEPIFCNALLADALETFHASGRVPDIRNAHLNIWRNFDDVTVSDVAFYLKLNHSRLVTSKLKWRPKLQKEVIVSWQSVQVSWVSTTVGGVTDRPTFCFITRVESSTCTRPC